MKRLTKRMPERYGAVYFSYLSKDVRELTNRLVTIEDILGDDYDIDRLHEIMQAVGLIGKFVYEKTPRGYISKYEVTSVRINDT